MMREISILTAVADTHAHYLPSAWQSLVREDLPNGWHLVWYVQSDGVGATTAAMCESFMDPRVRFSASDNRGGAAEARNLALARATGEVSLIFDVDDLLVPGCLGRVIAMLDSGHQWCAGQAIDDHAGRLTPRVGGYSARLTPDGHMPKEAAAFRRDEWLGRQTARRIGDCWEQYGVLPFHPATFATYTAHLWTAGGWPGLRRDEDTALIITVTDRHDGFVLPDEHIVYRHHERQTSTTLAPIAERTAFIRRRRAVSG